MRLYEEYKLSRQNVMKFIRQHSKRVKQLPPINKQTKAERELYGILKIQLSLAHGMKGDLEYSIKMLEEYLPLEEREFSNREHKSIVRKRIDKRSIEGIFPDGEVQYAAYQTDDGIEDIFKPDITQDILGCTTKRQRVMLFGYMYFNRTQEELAHLYGLTQPTVNEHIKTACNNIKRTLVEKYGEDDCCLLDVRPIDIDVLVDNKDQNILKNSIL